MSNLKTVSQETFDAVVKENLDEFEMPADDAVNDAIQQFKAQNIGLFNIVKHVYVNNENEKKVLPSEKMRSLIEELESDDCEKALEAIKFECDQDLARRCLIASYGTVDKLMIMLRSGKCTEKVLATLISLTNGQPDVMKEDSLLYFLQLANELTRKQDACDKTSLGGILKILLHCCIKHEGNRQTLVNAGVVDLAAVIIQNNKCVQELIAGSCALLRALTLDDDIRVPYGRAHEHAKLIVTNNSGISLLLDVTKVEQQNVNILSEIISTLSCLTVRNEFCQEINDSGGLSLIFNCVMENLGNIGLVKSCLNLLRTLAGNDTVKCEIIKAGGINFILSAMNKFQSEAKVCEAGCACIAALALRSPSNCEVIIEAGAAISIIHAMKIHKNEALVQKFACRAVRDLVSRCRQFCSAFLDNGVEDLIRGAAIRFPQQVSDDAKAALRDLGCEIELQELWTGQKGSIAQD